MRMAEDAVSMNMGTTVEMFVTSPACHHHTPEHPRAKAQMNRSGTPLPITSQDV
jgi:hypothetical protein